jgi:hypothetical protein
MHGITDHILRILSQHWLPISGAVLLLWLVKNRYKNGLNKYPGPFLASITDWWRFFDVYGRRPEITHRALHKKYGDVVRLGPNTLSFSDPSALKSIYGLNKGFIKVKSSTPSLQAIWDRPITNSRIVGLLHCPTVRRKGPPSTISLQFNG